MTDYPFSTIIGDVVRYIATAILGGIACTQAMRIVLWIYDNWIPPFGWDWIDTQPFFAITAMLATIAFSVLLPMWIAPKRRIGGIILGVVIVALHVRMMIYTTTYADEVPTAYRVLQVIVAILTLVCCYSFAQWEHPESA